jgi:hypothetical protein
MIIFSIEGFIGIQEGFPMNPSNAVLVFNNGKSTSFRTGGWIGNCH